MIQRIQSIYLLLAAVCSGILIYFLPLFQLEEQAIYVLTYPTFFILFILSTIVSLFSIFRYRNRKQQVVSGRINIIINFVLFGILMYMFYTDIKEDGTLGLGSFLPIIIVIFISLANRAIMKDEALVRSADRLR